MRIADSCLQASYAQPPLTAVGEVKIGLIGHYGHTSLCGCDSGGMPGEPGPGASYPQAAVLAMGPARRLARLAVMPPTGTTPQRIARLLRAQCGVLTQAAASAWLGQAAVRWRLETGRWQRPCHGIVVTHSGPLTHAQRLWAAVLACGQGAALAGLTAARLDGLSGFPDERIYLLVPAQPAGPVPAPRGRRPADQGDGRRRCSSGAPAAQDPDRAVAAGCGGLDGYRGRRPGSAGRRGPAAPDPRRGPGESPGRAAFPAAACAHRRHPGRHRRRRGALSELDFSRLVRRFRIRELVRQVVRLDAAGRRRWLDACWEQARLIVEIDGLWHMEATAWWADMRRDNEFTAGGWRVLRFPAFVLREHPNWLPPRSWRPSRSPRQADTWPRGRRARQLWKQHAAPATRKFHSRTLAGSRSHLGPPGPPGRSLAAARLSGWAAGRLLGGRDALIFGGRRTGPGTSSGSRHGPALLDRGGLPRSGAVGSAGERCLHTAEVAGSIPARPTEAGEPAGCCATPRATDEGGLTPLRPDLAALPVRA